MDELSFRNYMEELVLRMLPTVMNSMDICKCEQCKMDIVAYALNNLPPKYVVSDKGGIFTRLETMQSQFDADIITAITRGASLVSENIRH